jgi:hypothetical protein
MVRGLGESGGHFWAPAANQIGSTGGSAGMRLLSSASW